MANKHLLDRPHEMKNPTWWWYEEPKGIYLCHQIMHGGIQLRTDSIGIRWDAIRKALARKDKK